MPDVTHYCECGPPEKDKMLVFCPRHRIDKSEFLWKKCQERGRWWDAWEREIKPAVRKQKKPQPPPSDFKTDLAEFGVAVNDKELLSLWRRWRKALERWKAAGKPIRTEAEMAERLEICKSCDQYAMRAGLIGYCKVCGCCVSAIKLGELNKIRMATESCPLKTAEYPSGKWQ